MAWKLDSLRGKTVLHLSEASKHCVSALRQVNSLGNLHVHTVKLGDAAVIISIFSRTWSRRAANYCSGGVRSGRNVHSFQRQSRVRQMPCPYQLASRVAIRPH